MRCNWSLAKTRFGSVLDYSRGDAIGIWLKQVLELSWNIFDEMHKEFGSKKFWNCLKKISTRCNWILARTVFGISLECFRRDAIGFWPRQDLELFQNIFNEMQLEFG